MGIADFAVAIRPSSTCQVAFSVLAIIASYVGQTDSVEDLDNTGWRSRC